MNQSMSLWARYNRATDEKLQTLMAGLDPSAYTQERNTYFKSLAGLHLHYVQTYRFYQGLIRKNTGNKFFVGPLTEENYEWTASSLADVSRLALELDDQYLAFAQAVTDEDLAGFKAPRTMRNGKTYVLSVGDVVTQYQNHTAHHRGQLSQLLDELGVEHDVGGLLVFTTEA